jgi:hypothetical protein
MPMSIMFEHTLKLFFVTDNREAFLEEIRSKNIRLRHSCKAHSSFGQSLLRNIRRRHPLLRNILPISLELFLIFIKNYP